MVMMAPAVVVAAVPTVVVAATAVMAPSMPMPVSMSVAPFDLNNDLIGSAQRRGCCYRHSRRCDSWRERKGTAGKPDYKNPLHFAASSFVANGSYGLSVRLVQC
jgi:hypothetical protein